MAPPGALGRACPGWPSAAAPGVTHVGSARSVGEALSRTLRYGLMRAIGTRTGRFPGGGGSRRDLSAQERVIAATRDLLAEVGYANLSIEAVAARACVGKPTIYRWWNNKAHLAYEASCSTAAQVVVPDTGEFAADLRRFVRRVADSLWREDG